MTLAFYSPPPRPADEASRQSVVDASGVLAMTDAAVLQRLVEAAAALFDAPMAALSIIDRDRQYLVARTGLEARETSRAASFCGHTILTPDAALVVSDAQKDPRFDGNPAVRSDPHIRFYAGVAVAGDAGQPLGALCVLDDAVHDAPDEHLLHALKCLGAEASAAIYARDDSRSSA